MSDYVLYNYTPSLAAAIICMILFIAIAFGHIFFVWKHKTKFFITFIIGGLFEAVGYGARAVNAHEAPNYSTMPYALQSLFVLLAPSLFAASIYMILGRIIRLLDGDSRSLIRATRLTKIFVLGDVLAFFIQSGGGGIMSSAKSASSLKLGEDVIIVGLIVQIIFFGFFVVVSVIFHKRMANDPTSAAMATSVDWHRYMLVLYFASALIMTRCVYRVIEYIQGSTGVLQSHEYFAYIFDAALMLLVTISFLVFHPSQIISGGHRKLDDMELMRGDMA
ncbi:RTA1 like protein [Penicillium camemberti]|uniref:RTA1 like protein n=1 Tax=Penicillium camemberti (strain FM 013) TaxID=1429867 RepID=A0A0G4PMP2_PENC3|nr:RTA1 like protein [Penicillium camemberti]